MELQRSDRRRDAHLMAGVTFSLGFALVLWAHIGGELIPVNGGIGYDGSVYARVVRTPRYWLGGGHLDMHRVQRVLPSLVVHILLRPFDLHRNDDAIIWSFHLLNLGLLVASTYVWSSVTRHLSISRRAAVVGFLGLFVTFATLKFPGYYPVLTDVSGFALGMLLLWALVASRYGWMLVITVAGAWTWPTVAYSGVVLYGLSASNRSEEIPSSGRWLSGRWSSWLTLSTAGLVVLGALATYRCYLGDDGCVSPLLGKVFTDSLLVISVGLLCLYVLFAVGPLTKQLRPRRVISAVHLRRLAVVLTVLIVIRILQVEIAQSGTVSLVDTLRNVAFGSISKPAVFLVSHIYYFGPVVLVVVLLWPLIVDVMAEHGVGLVVLIFVYVLLTVGAESRLIMNVWPFFVAFTAKALDSREWTLRQVGWLALISLVVSRMWLPISIGHVNGNPGGLYTMWLGHRLTIDDYVFAVPGAILTGVAIYLLLRPGRASSDRPDRSCHGESVMLADG